MDSDDPGKQSRINFLFDILAVDPRFGDCHLAAALEAADGLLVLVASSAALEFVILILQDPLRSDYFGKLP